MHQPISSEYERPACSVCPPLMTCSQGGDPGKAEAVCDNKLYVEEIVASLQQHMKDCQHFLGASFENVHRWLDEFMPKLGANHRRVRHHREGIAEVQKLFGAEAENAAIIHILRDCRNVPRAED